MRKLVFALALVALAGCSGSQSGTNASTTGTNASGGSDGSAATTEGSSGTSSDNGSSASSASSGGSSASSGGPTSTSSSSSSTSTGTSSTSSSSSSGTTGTSSSSSSSTTGQTTAGTTGTSSPGAGLFFSEYVESSSNKALELYNNTIDDPLDLSQFAIQLYSNQTATVSATLNLTGSVAQGQTFVICKSSSGSTIPAADCNLTTTSTAMNFNGDDSIRLVHKADGAQIDRFGGGTYPGSAGWSANGVVSKDVTLRRKCSVGTGDTAWTDFDPSVQWDAYPQDTFCDLGGFCGTTATCTQTTGGTTSSTGSTGSTGTTASSSTTGSTGSSAGTTGSSAGGTTGALACTPGTEGLGVPLVSAGTEPSTVKLADVNNDQKLDALAVNYSARTISVMLGRGDGTFANRSTQAITGASGRGIAVGEFTGDSKVDLAVGDESYDGVITVLKGANSGAFTPYTTLQPQSVSGNAFYPGDVAAADLDGDGRTDLIVANEGYTQVGVYAGLDGGGFGPMTAYPTTPQGNSLYALAVADFNGDQRPDVAAAVDTSPGAVKLFINSSGGLAPQSGTLATANYPSHLVAADLNADAKPDLVVGGERADGHGVVSVLMGQGNASFASASTLTPAFSEVDGLDVADVDHDGSPDIVVGGPRLVEVFYGDGAGNFDRTAVFDAPATSALAAGDLNADLHDDVVVTGTDGMLAVLMANPSGTLLDGRYLAGATGTTPTAPLAAELNGDGVPDLVELNPGDQGFTVFNSLAPGVYDVPLPFALGTGANPVGMVAGDFTGDGKVELVIANSGTHQVAMLPGKGDGTFDLPKYTSVTAIASGVTQALAAADFNHDGKLDVAVIDSTNDKVWLLPNQLGPTTQFGTPVAASLPSGMRPKAILAGHFSTGSGPDLAVLDASSSQVVTLLNDGSGGFPTSGNTTLNAVGISLSLVKGAGGALDGLVVAENGAWEVLASPTAGSFTTVAEQGFTGISGAALVDLNGDGYPDLVVTNTTFQQIVVYLGLAGGGFGTGYAFASPAPGLPVIADLNLDGNPDLFTTTGAGLSFWLNGCWAP